MDNTKLIAALEGATGPDRELDAAIAVASGRMRYNGTIRLFEPYTASIDAALALVPEGWACFHLFCVKGCRFVWEADIGPELPDFRGQAATPALAICIAALRAREAHALHTDRKDEA